MARHPRQRRAAHLLDALVVALSVATASPFTFAFASCGADINYGVMIDAGATVGSSGFALEKQFVQNLVSDTWTPGSRYVLGQYGQLGASLDFNNVASTTPTDAASITSTISTWFYLGQEQRYKTTLAAAGAALGSTGTRALVLVAGGGALRGEGFPAFVDAAVRAQAAGVNVAIVEVTGAGAATLSGLASPGLHFTVASFDSLPALASTVSSVLCARAPPSFPPPASPPPSPPPPSPSPPPPPSPSPEPPSPPPPSPSPPPPSPSPPPPPPTDNEAPYNPGCGLATAAGDVPTFCGQAGEGLFADPCACNRFYNCGPRDLSGMGTGGLLTCPAGLYYNAATQQCDYPGQPGVTCTDGQ